MKAREVIEYIEESTGVSFRYAISKQYKYRRSVLNFLGHLKTKDAKILHKLGLKKNDYTNPTIRHKYFKEVIEPEYLKTKALIENFKCPNLGENRKCKYMCLTNCVEGYKF